MSTSRDPQLTDFTHDVLGRYVCNGLDEALASTTARPDARPFDVIVLGGGTFGGILAEQIWFRDRSHRRRVLVLEAGPMVLPEHVQNLPLVGVKLPVWETPWTSSVPFSGLAMCLGGRSLLWGGWAPSMLPGEWAGWPDEVREELEGHYLAEAKGLLGLVDTNDFIHGSLHTALRELLLDAVGTIPELVPLSEIPDPGADRATATELEQKLGLPSPSGYGEQDLRDLWRLEAPLAVQGAPPRAGFFPLNKFSSVPLLIQAARQAQLEAELARTPDVRSAGDDVKKRLMVVPRCRVLRLVTDGPRVVAVETTQGRVPVPEHGVVVLALGTIESTRLALAAFGRTPGTGPIGRNLHVHLRSNLVIRFPRTQVPGISESTVDLEASALFLKGVHRHEGKDAWFHLQITAGGGGRTSTDSEAVLFKKVPDTDSLDAMHRASATHVVVAIRCVGQTEHGPDHPNAVVLGDEIDAWGEPRAHVVLGSTPRDELLWRAMEDAAMEVAKALAGGGPMEILSRAPDGTPGPTRDGLGTTHHEAGSLWMGADAAGSVTDLDGKLHGVENLHAIGPALFPGSGSPNPMLNGVALARRLGDRLASPIPFVPDPGFRALFDGVSTAGFRMSTIRNQPNDDPGRFLVVDGALEAAPGTDLGLFWHTTPLPEDFVVRLRFRKFREDDNSGVFFRFPDPEGRGYDNTAWVGVHFGFEVQIEDVPGRDPIHRTGALYDVVGQTLAPAPSRPLGEWNDLEIAAVGQDYTVKLNGVLVSSYRNPDPNRGTEHPSYFGLQTHTGRVQFRDIQLSGDPATLR